MKNKYAPDQIVVIKKTGRPVKLFKLADQPFIDDSGYVYFDFGGEDSWAHVDELRPLTKKENGGDGRGAVSSASAPEAL